MTEVDTLAEEATVEAEAVSVVLCVLFRMMDVGLLLWVVFLWWNISLTAGIARFLTQDMMIIVADTEVGGHLSKALCYS